MRIPILIEGEKAGALRIEQEGLYTVFEARLPAGGEGLTRLWVAGGGQSGYLGVMEPRPEERFLRRRLSAAELRRLPERLEYACTAEPVFSAPEVPEPAGAEPPEAEDSQEEAETGEDRNSGSGPGATGPPSPPEETEAGQLPEPELLWFSRPDGSLSAHDGRSCLLALPASLRRRPKGLRLLRINGREYLVFRT